MRADLVAAADRILAATGDVEALSLRGVAREVGIATPSIYLHFPDKATLVRAVLEERFAELATTVREAIGAADGPTAQLLAGCLAYCRFATDHPNAYRVLFGRLPSASASASPLASPPESRSDSLSLRGPVPPAPACRSGGGGMRGWPHAKTEVGLPVGAEAFGSLVGGVTACMRAGLAPPADPMRTATSVWTALHGIVTLRASIPQFPWPPLEQQVEDVLRGLVGWAGSRHNQVTEDGTVSE